MTYLVMGPWPGSPLDQWMVIAEPYREMKGSPGGPGAPEDPEQSWRQGGTNWHVAIPALVALGELCPPHLLPHPGTAVPHIPPYLPQAPW